MPLFVHRDCGADEVAMDRVGSQLDCNVEMGPLYGTTRRYFGVEPSDGDALDDVDLLVERNLLPFDITLRAERCQSLLRLGALGGVGAKLSKGLLAGGDFVADSDDADADAAENGSKLFMVKNRPSDYIRVLGLGRRPLVLYRSSSSVVGRSTPLLFGNCGSVQMVGPQAPVSGAARAPNKKKDMDTYPQISPLYGC